MLESLESPLSLVAQCVEIRRDEIRITIGNAEVTEKIDDERSLKARLPHLIYVWLYSRSHIDKEPLQASHIKRSMISELLASVPRTREIDWSWQIRNRSNDGGVIASSGDQIVELSAGEYILSPGLQGDEHSSSIGILKWSIGYDDVDDWLFVRCGRPGIARSSREVRVYFNAIAAGALAVVANVIRAIDAWKIPFVLKCHTKASNYRRRDPIVLYLDRREAYVALESIGSRYRSFANFLVPDVPLFSLLLLPGVGLAETPHHGGSFGAARSSLCADAVISAGLGACYQEKLQSLEAAFRQAGLSIQEPFRNPGDLYEYDYVRIRDIAAST